MLSKNILNSVFGYIQFTAENGFAERFINTCTAENIPLWDMHRLGDRMTAKTTVNGYKNIRSPARKSSMRVRMTKKVGLPFFINRHIKRTGLIAGFAVLVVTLIILSGHVWIIDITGNEKISDTEVLEAFEAAGLTIGSRISTLDITKIENQAVIALNKASWAAINFKGCVAEINIRELKETPEIEKHSGYSNIIARKDGQVEILEVYRGSAAIMLGQTVTKGDLLISGVTESKTQLSLFADADGYAVAKTNISVETQTSNKITELIPKTKKVWSFYFLGKEIFPPRKEDGVCYTHKSRLQINGKTLPFGINYRLYTVFEEKEKTISQAEAKLMAINNYALESYNQTLHAQIINSDVELVQDKDKVTVKGNYFCYESIGESVSFEVEETETQDEILTE